MKERTMPILWWAYWALILSVGGLVGACQTDAPDYPEAPDRVEPLAWRTNADGLRAPITLDTVGVQFQVPVGWSMLDRTAAERARRAVAPYRDTVDVRLVAGYGEQRTSSFLVVSILRGGELAAGHEGDPISKMLPVVRQVQADRTPVLRVDTLQRPGRPALIDVVIASQRIIHHKVLFEGAESELVQFDYVAPRIQYPRVAPRIEASVSSIRRRR
jgi:hypothetical protein